MLFPHVSLAGWRRYGTDETGRRSAHLLSACDSGGTEMGTAQMRHISDLGHVLCACVSGGMEMGRDNGGLVQLKYQTL